MARRHLVNERNREELDEVSNKRLTSMAYDIAKGLEYLAEQKYVHRDIACRFVSNLHPRTPMSIHPFYSIYNTLSLSCTISYFETPALLTCILT